jgi:hypothetical protein
MTTSRMEAGLLFSLAVVLTPALLWTMAAIASLALHQSWLGSV